MKRTLSVVLGIATLAISTPSSATTMVASMSGYFEDTNGYFTDFNYPGFNSEEDGYLRDFEYNFYYERESLVTVPYGPGAIFED